MTEEAQEELFAAMEEDELSSKVVLVYANKQDLDGALDAETLAEKLKLSSIKDRKWFIQPCCAKTGNGLYDGLDWLTSNM